MQQSRFACEISFSSALTRNFLTRTQLADEFRCPLRWPRQRRLKSTFEVAICCRTAIADSPYMSSFRAEGYHALSAAQLNSGLRYKKLMEKDLAKTIRVEQRRTPVKFRPEPVALVAGGRMHATNGLHDEFRLVRLDHVVAVIRPDEQAIGR